MIFKLFEMRFCLSSLSSNPFFPKGEKEIEILLAQGEGYSSGHPMKQYQAEYILLKQ